MQSFLKPSCNSVWNLLLPKTFLEPSLQPSFRTFRFYTSWNLVGIFEPCPELLEKVNYRWCWYNTHGVSAPVAKTFFLPEHSTLQTRVFFCGIYGGQSLPDVEHMSTIQNGHLFRSAELTQIWMLCWGRGKKTNGFAHSCTACTRKVNIFAQMANHDKNEFRETGQCTVHWCFSSYAAPSASTCGNTYTNKTEIASFLSVTNNHRLEAWIRRKSLSLFSSTFCSRIVGLILTMFRYAWSRVSSGVSDFSDRFFFVVFVSDSSIRPGSKVTVLRSLDIQSKRNKDVVPKSRVVLEMQSTHISCFTLLPHLKES